LTGLENARCSLEKTLILVEAAHIVPVSKAVVAAVL